MQKKTMLAIRNKLKRSSFGRAFVVTFFFVTLASSLFWLDFFRSYNTEVVVLVISRSNTVENSSSIADNMVALTQTLSFYNRLLIENDSLDDDFLGYAPDKRKESWNERVFVTKQNASGVLVIRANGDTPEKSKQFASQTVRTMFSVTGLYYNVKTDVDMRIVDGPLVSYTLQKPFLYIGTSFLTSLFLTSFFFFFLRVVPELIGRKKEREISSDASSSTENGNFDDLDTRYAYPEFTASDTLPRINLKKFIPEKPQALSFERLVQEEESSQRVYGTQNVKHASAPVNLPVASDERDFPAVDEASLPFEFETVSEEIEIPEGESFENTIPTVDKMFPPVSSQRELEQEEPASAISTSEPTQEDYKRRLNELLANVK